MYEYRITKYDPNKKNNKGHYLDIDEWTSFSDVGEKISLKNYETIEKAYIMSAIDLLLNAGVVSLKIKGLENHQKKSKLNENEKLPMSLIYLNLQSVLRNEFWCKFESEKGFIHFGYDYYMYVGVSKTDASIMQKITSRGLFTEEFISPYNEKNC